MTSTITQTIRTGSPITVSVAHAGARGAAGLKGDPGEKGDKGDQGDAGVAAAHAATHATGGSDELTPAAIGAATPAQLVAAVAAEASARDVAIGLAVTAALNALLDGAPGALDTLNELAAAVNDDASFAASVTAALATKVAEGDPRLTNARPPTAHAASHGEGQSDALTLAMAQVTGLVTRLAELEAPTINAQAGPAYTFVLADARRWSRFSNAGPVTATIPPNSGVAFPVGTVLQAEQAGAGALTLAAGVGVTLRRGASQTLTAREQYAAVAAKQVAADEWVVFGNLAEA